MRRGLLLDRPVGEPAHAQVRAERRRPAGHHVGEPERVRILVAAQRSTGRRCTPGRARRPGTSVAAAGARRRSPACGPPRSVIRATNASARAAGWRSAGRSRRCGCRRRRRRSPSRPSPDVLDAVAVAEDQLGEDRPLGGDQLARRARPRRRRSVAQRARRWSARRPVDRQVELAVGALDPPVRPATCRARVRSSSAASAVSTAGGRVNDTIGWPSSSRLSGVVEARRGRRSSTPGTRTSSRAGRAGG